MRANADYHEPIRFFDARRIRLRIAQIDEVYILSGLDLLWRAVVDKHRLAAPCDSQALADLHWGEVDLGRRQRQGVARRVEAVDERPNRRGNPDRADCRRGQDQKIAARLACMCSAGIVLRQIGHSTLGYFAVALSLPP